MEIRDRMGRSNWLVIFACAALVGACTNSSLPSTGSTDLATADAEGPTDLPAPVDLAQSTSPDIATTPDLANPYNIGMACPVGNECGAGQVCLSAKLSSDLPPGGYCTKACAVDNDCGPGAFCGPAIPSVGNICFSSCVNDACPAGQLCGTRLNGGINLVRPACLPGNAAALDGSPCTSFADCNRNQVCANNPFETPGGFCATVGCKPGDDTTCAPATGNDGHCVDGGGGTTLCVDTCSVATDCRIAQSYLCVDPGIGTKICVMPKAHAGAACNTSSDCGPASSPWRCLTGASFPGGYCAGALGACSTSDTKTCPENSHCYDPTPAKPRSGDEFCAADCGSDTDCRMAAGYKCLNVGPNLTGCRL